MLYILSVDVGERVEPRAIFLFNFCNYFGKQFTKSIFTKCKPVKFLFQLIHRDVFNKYMLVHLFGRWQLVFLSIVLLKIL